MPTIFISLIKNYSYQPYGLFPISPNSDFFNYMNQKHPKLSPNTLSLYYSDKQLGKIVLNEKRKLDVILKQKAVDKKWAIEL